MILPLLFVAQTCLSITLLDGRESCARLVEVAPDAGLTDADRDVGIVDASQPDLGTPDASTSDVGVVDTSEVIQLAPGLVTEGPLSLAWSTSDVVVRGDPNEPAIFRTTGPCLLRNRNVPMRNVTFENIVCQATTRGRPDDQPCVKIVGEAQAGGIEFHNFSCVGYGSGIVVHPKATGDRIKGVLLDRVTVQDVYSTTSGQFATGLFAQAVDDLVVHDSSFVRTGAGTCFDHAVYVQGDSGPVVIDGSYFSGGGDVEIRSGGTVIESSFADAPDLLYFGGGSVITVGGVSGSITRSTFTGAKDFSTAYPGCGGAVKGRAIRVENTRSLEISDVVIRGSKSTTSPILLDATTNGSRVENVKLGKIDWDGVPSGVVLVEKRGDVK